MDFITADKYCQTYGGHLASVHNGFDNIFLVDQAKKSFSGAEMFAVGGNNLQDHKNWTWIDGTPVDFTDWGTYEPANADTQNCLHIDVVKAQWHSADCFVAVPFVCSVGSTSGAPPTMPSGSTTAGGGPNFPTPPVGNTPAYQQASDYFASVINTKVDPCDDFYNYTCGVYNLPMTFDTAQLSIYQDFYKAYSNPSSSAARPIKLVNTAYSTCYSARSNWNSITGDGSIISNLVAKFHQATQFGFPLMDKSVADWPNATQMGAGLGYLSGTQGVDTVISFFVDTNWKDNQGSQPYLAYIDQPVLTLSWTYYIGGTWDITKKSLSRYVNDTFQAYAQLQNIALDQTQVQADVNDILEFEHLLANNYSTDATTRWQMLRSYNLIKNSDFTLKYSFMDINEYFSHLAVYAPTVIAKLVDPGFQFDLMEPDRLKDLDQAIKNSFNGAVKPRTFYNYLYYRLLFANSDYFPQSSSKRYTPVDIVTNYEYKKQVLGKPKFTESKKSRLERMRKFENRDLDEISMDCIDDTLSYFTDASTRIMVDQVYPTPDSRNTIKTNVDKLADSIMIGMQSMIDGLNWMTPDTKKGAYDKIAKLTRNVAYPDYVTNDTALTNYYTELTDFDSTTDYYTVLGYLSRFMTQTSLEMLLKTTGTDRHDFNGPAGIVNAWYQPEENSITFPAGILRMPFYDPDWPKSVVFGAMGMVAGHELSHSFDSSGTQWDGTGNLNNWMDSLSQVAFDNMTTCVINEYNGFCPLDPAVYSPNCINGQQTVGENVADNAGIHSAFRAYKNAVDFYGEDPRLPGSLMSQFSHDQLFFLSFARLWCQSTPDPAREYVQILVDPHSPSKYRVFGSLQNYPAFR
ncbi:hypothetical protein FO519_009254 [Halicephalobus sp. NKZ332]|nr:hypothetical protein FO519_009254 [Halicephalobus sp. NKZ332]